MSVVFDFYESPMRDEEGKVCYHARPVTYKTISTERVIRDIHQKCSLTEGDVKAALAALNESMSGFLKDGFRVHLEGIGYFQVTLSCPKDAHPKKTRSQSVCFKSVRFRADKALKGNLIHLETERSTFKKHSARLSVEEIDKRLAGYFLKRRVLTRKIFQQLCGMTETTAARHIRRLISEGKIENINTRYQPIYMAVEGS